MTSWELIIVRLTTTKKLLLLRYRFSSITSTLEMRIEHKEVKVVEQFDKVSSGQLLRRERVNRSFSQEEVAEKIGTTATNVSRWELGHTSPTPYFRRQLCELFEKSPQELFPLTFQENIPSTSKPPLKH